jgi:D-alanyl-D-alanine carboxypeptidase/D-alanyl-D-alanine-endopeptidase (penicillin-binding protein 4)
MAHNAGRPMNPASVMKLVTTFAALELLGPDYRWKTGAYLDGPLDDGVLHGNLVLKGSGDPKITVEAWQAFMWALRAQGLAAIDGDLILDRSWLRVPASIRGIRRRPLKPYNVGPTRCSSASSRCAWCSRPTPPATRWTCGRAAAAGRGSQATAAARQRRVQRLARRAARVVRQSAGRAASPSRAIPGELRRADWWLALLDPPSYVHAMFRTYFEQAGGRFDGRVVENPRPRAAPFAVLESPPLWDIVRGVNKLEQRDGAPARLTLATTAFPPPATAANAAEVVRRWLARRRLEMPELVLDNGSGLSRAERISAGSLVRLLLAADASAVREEFASSLAVAAMDGTVEHRFQNGSVAGQALLKTGTLDGVRAVTGYVIDAEGRRFALAAIVNHANAGRAQDALDFLVQWVYRNAATWERLTHR